MRGIDKERERESIIAGMVQAEVRCQVSSILRSLQDIFCGSGGARWCSCSHHTESSPWHVSCAKVFGTVFLALALAVKAQGMPPRCLFQDGRGQIRRISQCCVACFSKATHRGKEGTICNESNARHVRELRSGTRNTLNRVWSFAFTHTQIVLFFFAYIFYYYQ